MNIVFADSFYFFAILNSADPAHHRATEISRAMRGHMLTTDWVLAEVADGFCRSRHRKIVAEYLTHLPSHPSVTIVPASRELFWQGLQLFAYRADKDWPLTDCISFVVMADELIKEAPTADRHFAQAGFKPILA